MQKKISLLFVLFSLILLIGMNANASSILLDEISHDYGSDAGKIDPGGEDPLFPDYVKIYDENPKYYNRFYDHFDLSGLNFVNINRFELTIDFSNTNDIYYCFFQEDWKLRPGGSSVYLLDIDQKGDGIFSQTFIIDSAIDTFGNMVSDEDFYFWLADEAWGSNNFKLYSATLKIYGEASTVPLPGAAWLFGTGLVGLLGLRRKLWRKS